MDCFCVAMLPPGPRHKKTTVRSPMGPEEIGTNPCNITLPLKPALTTLSPIAHISGPIRYKTFFKNEIWRDFLREWTVREYPGNFVREWTVRESTGNYSYGNGRYGKVREIFRTGMDGTGSPGIPVPYRTVREISRTVATLLNTLTNWLLNETLNYETNKLP